VGVGCRDGALPGAGYQKVVETAEAVVGRVVECDEMVGEMKTCARWRRLCCD
jgi:hypothetical protein